MPQKTAIFIDGGYLDYVIKDYGYKRIDFERFIQWLCGDKPLLRAYYYHCKPYVGSPPSDAETRMQSNADKFYTYLDTLPNVQTRFGKLKYRGKRDDGSPIYIQKGVDVKIGIDMVQLALKNKIGHVILVSGDADLLPAVDIAMEEGVEVTLVVSESNQTVASSALYRAVDNRKEFTKVVCESMLVNGNND